MRSPEHGFDLRRALELEVAAASAALAEGAEPRAIHRCRVALKRARALARVGAAAAPGLAGVFQSVARRTMAALAPARELAALTETARALASRETGRRSVALTRVADALAHEAASPRHADFETAGQGVRDLAALARVWPEMSARQIRAGAKKVAQRARAAAKRGRDAEDPERRHQWRKREKERLYALCGLGKHWSFRRRRRATERLGEVLGRERDVLLLIERVRLEPSLAGGDKDAKQALRSLAQRAKRLAARADRLGARVHAGGL
jgi:CHAD domain-containing protein